MKRRIAIALLALLAAGAPPAVAATRKHHAARCSLSGSKTLLATRDARIFVRTDAKRSTTSEYACLYARNKRFLLASGDSEPGGSGDTASLERLAGSYAAFVGSRFDDSQRYNPDFQGFPDTVEAINLSTGAVLRFPAVGGGGAAAGNVTDLVLAANGSFAWIGSGGPSGYEVRRLNVGDAAPALVDTGADIQPGSLALGGKTLYWTRGGRPSSAPLG